MANPRFPAIKIKMLEGHVGLIALDLPHKSNAMNADMWTSLPKGLAWLESQGANAIVLTGGDESRHFCAGLDLAALGSEALLPSAKDSHCEGRTRLEFLKLVRVLQAAMTACETCRCPIIAAVHGACFGAGIDLITACDVRLACEDAKFSVKEVDLAITADMGTLARLPGIVGAGVARDLALTARVIDATEALRMNLVSKCFSSRQELVKEAINLAISIAAKSPLAVTGTKRVLLRQRGRTVEESLDDVAMWNAAILVGSADLKEVFASRIENRKPRFSKL